MFIFIVGCKFLGVQELALSYTVFLDPGIMSVGKYVLNRTESADGLDFIKERVSLDHLCVTYLKPWIHRSLKCL